MATIRKQASGYRLAVLALPVVLLLFLAGACSACRSPLLPGRTATVAGSIDRLSVVSWNVQTLFDGETAGTEYDDYGARSGWDARDYAQRRAALAGGIKAFPAGGADVLALEEVENARVLRDLADGELGALGYRYRGFAASAGGALGIGILSRYPLSRVRSHAVSVFGDATPRPVLEVQLEPGGATIVLFVCHWKSKLGGDRATEPTRRAAAGLIARRLRELAVELPQAACLVLGDLNENADEFERRGGAYVTALLPDTAPAALLAGGHSDFLVLSGSQPPVAEHCNRSIPLYDPWFAGVWTGSYSYRGVWESIDHLLFSPGFFDRRAWEYASFAVAEGAPFTDSAGLPAAYNARTGTGLSDHLPIMAVLQRLPLTE